MLICVLILAVLTVGAAVLLITTPEPDDPVSNGGIEQPNGDEENGSDLDDSGVVYIPGPDIEPQPEPDPPEEENQDPPDPLPPAINSIIVTFGGSPLTHHDEYSAAVGDRLALGVRIDPAAAADYAEIRWESSNPAIVEVVPIPEDETNLTVMATHIAPGVTTITVFVDDLFFEVTVRVS
jgi:hypothetical protein